MLVDFKAETSNEIRSHIVSRTVRSAVSPPFSKFGLCSRWEEGSCNFVDVGKDLAAK